MTELFAEALELPPGERGAFLDRACAGDDALRQEVEALLAAGQEADGFFHSLAERGDPAGPGRAGRAGRRPGGTDLRRVRGGGRDRARRDGRGLPRGGPAAPPAVALKFLHDPALADPAARARLLHEARAASGLDDPNICTIFELAETPEGETFFAMAYYAGETLAQRLKRGPIPLGEAWQIAVGITRGLAAAHAKGIVHRDLTPRNVMLPSRDTVKILDFGLAGAARETGSLAGTPAYMPPELILGDPSGMTGDVWTLGVTLYELFTGQRPFTGRDAGTVPEAVLGVAPIPPRKLNPGFPRRSTA